MIQLLLTVILGITPHEVHFWALDQAKFREFARTFPKLKSRTMMHNIVQPAHVEKSA